MNKTIPSSNFVFSDCEYECYNNESLMEKRLLDEFARLVDQNNKPEYERIKISNSQELKDNLRNQLERLNNKKFADWDSFFNSKIANPNLSVIDKQKLIQKNYLQTAECLEPDGTICDENFLLFDHEWPENNLLQVMEQYVQNSDGEKTRYDVTVLVNGFPMVQIELKKCNVAIQNAFNQIQRYQRNSYHANDKLFEFIELFVISNGDVTRYFANTIHKFYNSNDALSSIRTTSFAKTISWAREDNHVINDLVDFTKTFFSKKTLLKILSEYMVFTQDEQLLVMRPYQICAAEAVLEAVNNKRNGYIWHTTGSGKTLTSFKIAQLLTRNSDIKKVLFVVDRRDLDQQSNREYDNYEKDSVKSVNSVSNLKKQLFHDKNRKFLVTTVQKLNRLISNCSENQTFSEKTILIFDECHRSTFGKMMNHIQNFFTNFNMYGFTGTPIFKPIPENGYLTTEKIFGEALHKYTIVNAIDDENVLRFKTSFVENTRMKEEIKNEEVQSIDKNSALESEERIRKICRYILENFDDYVGKEFTSMLTTSSISMARKYYNELNKQINKNQMDLKTAIIYSCADNPSNLDGVEYSIDEIPGEDDGDIDNYRTDDKLNVDDRAFLESAISKYNSDFQTNFQEHFEGQKYVEKNSLNAYYEDVLKRTKRAEIKLLIVVNMCLTGFDAPRMQTLWVDRYLKEHNLIQAFSRTNRLYNEAKSWGNIVTFRNLKKETDEALSIFGDPNAKIKIEVPPFNVFFYGTEDTIYGKSFLFSEGFKPLVEKLLQKFDLNKGPDKIFNEIKNGQKWEEFFKFFSKIYKLRYLMKSYVEPEYKKQIQELISDQQFDCAKAVYFKIYQKYINRSKYNVDISNDLDYDADLIEEDQYGVDKILNLVYKARMDRENYNKDINFVITKIDTSVDLVPKKELIERFIEKLNGEQWIENKIDFDKFFINYWKESFEQDLEEMAKKFKLKLEELKIFFKNAFQSDELDFSGEKIINLFQKRPSLFHSDEDNEQNIKSEIIDLFNKYKNQEKWGEIYGQQTEPKGWNS